MKNLSKICAVWLLSNLLCSCFLFRGAAPMVPVPQQEKQASFDGTKQDSGIIAVLPSGFLVTSHFVDRYDGMVSTYGAEPEFMPPLVKGAGVSPAPAEEVAKYPDRGELKVVTPQAMTLFVKLNQWRKMGKVPVAQKAQPGVVSRVINAVTQ